MNEILAMKEAYERVTEIANNLEAENKRLREALHVFDGRNPVVQLTYHVIDENGRVCVYYTKRGVDAHFVLYDSLDTVRP